MVSIAAELEESVGATVSYPAEERPGGSCRGEYNTVADVRNERHSAVSDI